MSCLSMMEEALKWTLMAILLSICRWEQKTLHKISARGVGFRVRIGGLHSQGGLIAGTWQSL